VNNVIYNRYAETARIFWASNIATHMDPSHKNEWSEMWTPKGTGMILRRIETVFKFPLQFPDKVTVLHELQSRPLASTDSFALDVLILSELHQRVAARCLEDIVVYDYRKAAKTPLRGFMVDVFQEIFDRQEEAKRKSNAMVRDILERVTRLEKSSWDREGAVEKIGST
jgi:acyl-CoA thioesterase FadM